MSARQVRGAWSVAGAAFELEARLEEGRLTLSVAGSQARVLEAQVTRLADGSLRIVRAGRVVRATVQRLPDRTLVAVDGVVTELRPVEAGRRGHHAAEDEPFAVSPMTGLLVKVTVAPGEAVAEGAPLFVVEAMKMEFVVKAARACTVAEVRRKAGDKVALGEVVVAFVEEQPT